MGQAGTHQGIDGGKKNIGGFPSHRVEGQGDTNGGAVRAHGTLVLGHDMARIHTTYREVTGGGEHLAVEQIGVGLVEHQVGDDHAPGGQARRVAPAGVGRGIGQGADHRFLRHMDGDAARRQIGVLHEGVGLGAHVVAHDDAAHSHRFGGARHRGGHLWNGQRRCGREHLGANIFKRHIGHRAGKAQRPVLRVIGGSGQGDFGFHPQVVKRAAVSAFGPGLDSVGQLGRAHGDAQAADEKRVAVDDELHVKAVGALGVIALDCVGRRCRSFALFYGAQLGAQAGGRIAGGQAAQGPRAPGVATKDEQVIARGGLGHHADAVGVAQRRVQRGFNQLGLVQFGGALGAFGFGGGAHHQRAVGVVEHADAELAHVGGEQFAAEGDVKHHAASGKREGQGAARVVLVESDRDVVFAEPVRQGGLQRRGVGFAVAGEN